MNINHDVKYELLCGDSLSVLRTLPSGSVHCCITSPPYYGLRDYGVDGQIGLEETPDEYIQKLVDVCREVRRVMRDDATFWLNLGDSYAQSGNNRTEVKDIMKSTLGGGKGTLQNSLRCCANHGLKPKDRMMIPARVAIALQADGWYLRDEIIWAKPNSMPSSVTDRTTPMHEMIYLLTKKPRYFYDAEAIKDNSSENSGWAKQRSVCKNTWEYNNTDSRIKQTGQRIDASTFGVVGKRNKRSVWTVTTQPYKEAHFATFPPKLIEPCVLAGTSEKGCCAECGAPVQRIIEKGETTAREGMQNNSCTTLRSDALRYSGRFGEMSTKTTGWRATCDCNAETVPCTILDPFAGACTTGVVAIQHRRNSILIELNPEYIEMSNARLEQALRANRQMELF